MLHPLQTHEFEDQMLELIDRQAEFTGSDLQGIVGALVNKILEAGKNLSHTNNASVAARF